MEESSSSLGSRDAVFYHVRVKPKDVGRFVLLPGDPDRVPLISQLLSRASKVSGHREFTVYDGYVDGELLTAASTGIGAPAAAIVVEELAKAGASTFIRVGTCGPIQRSVRMGDLVVASSSVRLDGTSRHYVVPEYPASASPQVVYALAAAAHKLGLGFHVGIAASTDSFYLGQGRYGVKGFQNPDSLRLAKAMRNARVLCFEMESSILFTLANLYGLRAGAVFAAVPARVGWSQRLESERAACKTAVEAVRILMKWDAEAEKKGLNFWIP